SVSWVDGPSPNGLRPIQRPKPPARSLGLWPDPGDRLGRSLAPGEADRWPDHDRLPAAGGQLGRRLSQAAGRGIRETGGRRRSLRHRACQRAYTGRPVDPEGYAIRLQPAADRFPDPAGPWPAVLCRPWPVLARWHEADLAGPASGVPLGREADGAD